MPNPSTEIIIYTLHIKNIYSEGELGQDATCKEYLQVQTEGSWEVSRNTKFCNLKEN